MRLLCELRHQCRGVQHYPLYSFTTQNVTITNTSTTTIGVNPYLGLGNANFEIANSNCGTLGAHQSCFVTVAFYPQAIGVLTDVLRVFASDGSAPALVQVTGTGSGGNTTPASFTMNVNPGVLNLASGQTGTASFTDAYWRLQRHHHAHVRWPSGWRCLHLRSADAHR